jgi:hypothetical protein
MKYKTIPLTMLLLLLLNLVSWFVPTVLQANTLHPYKNELLITNQERTREKIFFTNNSRKDILFTPVIYSFDPQTLELTQDGHIFTRADQEIFSVKPEETLEIDYEIVPVSNMRPGTYFNLIVLETQAEDTFVTETNPIGAIDSLSHLAVLHIADPEGDIYGITSEFAQISLEVVERGIPFIKPTVIKYTYQNITDYVLNPMGEIQIYSKQGHYPPIYLKINKEQEKIYPQGLLEEELEIDQYHIADFYSDRVIVGRFYNGIDENLILKEITLEPNVTLFIGIGIGIVFTAILLKIIFSKRSKKSKKNSE